MDESRKQFEAEMAKLGDCVDMRRAKNGDEEYMEWDVRLAWRFWNLSRAAVETDSTHEKVIGSFNTENNELAIFDKNIAVEKFAHWHVHNKFEVVIRPSRAAGIKVKE